jgi:hypothetical protein
MKLDLPKQELLKQLLDYNPMSGVFIWKEKNSSHIACSRILKVINSRNCGKVAGKVSPDGYIRIGIFGKKYLAHRLAWVYMNGDVEIDQIDHINGSRKDNRIANLRSIAEAANKRNMGVSKRNKSGVTGVIWHKQTGKWLASIYWNKKSVHLGLFDDIEEAREIRELAQVEAGFHRNHGSREAFRA